MDSTLITVSVLAVAGISIWLYNRRSVSQLNAEIQDKNAIITALKTHVETEIVEPKQSRRKTTTKTTDKKTVAKIKSSPSKGTGKRKTTKN